MQLIDVLRVNVTPLSETALAQATKDGVLTENYEALNVRLGASHVGYVNTNKFYYTEGQDTIDSLPSWTSPYGRPVIKHHDAKRDPLGRVRRAEYVDLTSLQDSENSPKGLVMLDTVITDKDGIRQVMNGELLTVSIKAVSDDIKCSICDHQVKPDDTCEHERGKTYDEKQCYWIIGKRKYKEVSFVNEPADESEKHFAGVVSWDMSELPKNFTKEDFGDNPEEDIKASDGVAITFADSAVPVTVSAVPKEGKALSLHDGVEMTEEITLPDMDIGWTEDDIAMLTWLDDNLDEEVVRVRAELGLEDAPMSEEAKKKSDKEGGHFCGPHDPRKGRRSFPVGDCPHAISALRLLGRYKGPGSKSKIKACVMRRMNAMGCKSSEDYAAETLTLTEQFKQATTELDTLKDRYSDEHIFDAPVVKTAVEDYKKKIEELQAKVDTLTSQMESTIDEKSAVSILEDENAKLYLLIRKFRAERLVDLEIRTGKANDISSSENPVETRSKRIKELMDKDSAELVTAYDELARQSTYGIVLRPNVPMKKIEKPGLETKDSHKEVPGRRKETRLEKTVRLLKPTLTQ